MSYNTLGIIKSGVKEKMPVVMVSPKVDGPDYVEVTADGVKSLSTLLDELHALIDISKLSAACCAEIVSINGNTIEYDFEYLDTSNNVYCTMSLITASGAEMNTLTIKSAGSTRKSAIGTSVTDESSSVFDSGTKIRMRYNTATLDLTTRASNTIYDNSNSGLDATEVQGAIDEVVDRQKGKVIAEVTADGVKKYGEILNALVSAMSETPTPHSVLRDNNQYSVFVESNGTGYKFTRTTMTSNHVTIATFYLVPGGSTVYGLDFSGGSWTITDHSNTVVPSGLKFILYN